VASERFSDVPALVRAELSNRLRRRPADPPVSVAEADALADLGVGSLELLELADALETALEVNPFDSGVSLTEMRTVSDLCAAYQAAVSGRPSPADDDLLHASRKRAEARRRPRSL
jgi:acyl carrier protein